MMWNRIEKIVLCTLLGMASFALYADDFADMVQTLAELKKNYVTAIRADRQSGIAKEYAAKLQDMERQAKTVQNTIDRMNLGEDFNFTLHTQRVKSSYNGRVPYAGERSKRHSMESLSGPSFAFEMMLADVQTLRKMGFSTENGGSIQKQMREKTGMLELERGLNFYMANLTRGRTLREDSVWREYFEKRLSRMKYLSREITGKLSRLNSPLLKKYNLPGEVNNLLNQYAKLSLKDNTLTAKKTSKKQIEGDSDNEKEELDKIMESIQYSEKQIRSMIEELNASGFKLESDTEPAHPKPQPSPPADEKNEVPDWESLSGKELAEKLTELRDSIVKSNTLLTGVDNTVIKYYTETLTKEQREKFSNLTEKYKNRGYDAKMVRSSAFLEMHSLLKAGQMRESREETIQILKRFNDKKKNSLEKELSKEKFKTEWK